MPALKKIELAGKLQRLAESGGTEHEKAVAAEKLVALMKKHGITEEDLDDGAVRDYEFKYSNKREFHLLLQVSLKTCPPDTKYYDYRRGGRKVRNTIGIGCTLAQKVEIEYLFDFYLDLYRREEDALFRAFVNKHALFRDSGKISYVDEDEYSEMVGMMDAMADADPVRRIEGQI